MFTGVNSVGIGVSDMEKALEFYGNRLGFAQVLFDYSGPLPGMEKVTGKPNTRARVVTLKNCNTGPLGLGMLKLVQLLPPDKAEPCTVVKSTLWGDVGLLEVCFNTRVSTEQVFAKLWKDGIRTVVAPVGASFSSSSYGTVNNRFAYIEDEDGGLVELIDWQMCQSLGTEPLVEGVNHVGLGVSDIEKSMKFYQELGFTELIFDSMGVNQYKMATMFPPNPPRIRAMMLANFYGAWVEPVQLLPPYKPAPFKKAWGHLGAMEFSVGVTNLEKACKELQRKGIGFLCPPQTVEVSSGQWKYAYITEPDNLYVSLVEPRY